MEVHKKSIKENFHILVLVNTSNALVLQKRLYYNSFVYFTQRMFMLLLFGRRKRSSKLKVLPSRCPLLLRASAFPPPLGPGGPGTFV